MPARPTSAAPAWVLRLGAVAALVNIALILVQIIVFSISPPPETTTAWLALLQERPILAMINLDLIYLLNNLLILPIYFALYIAVRHRYEVSGLFALLLGVVGLAAYVPSNTAFEMLRLRGTLTAATADALLAKYYGSAFITYYVLNALSLLLFAGILLRIPAFNRWTAYTGLGAGALMLVPSPFGIIGLAFAFASLLPWVAFSALLAVDLLRLLPTATVPRHPPEVTTAPG